MAAELVLIFRALDFAARKHKDQRRKNIEETPYINHPIEVAEILVRVGGVYDTNTIAAAILHDTLEDTEATEEELRRLFGAGIAGIVVEVSDDKSLPARQRKQLQVERALSSSEPARLIKLADKICNLRDLTQQPPAGWSSERISEYFDWAKSVVDQLRGTNANLEAMFDNVYGKKAAV